MMWFTRSEFDREVCFHAVGGVRGSLEWEDFENVQLPIPHIDKPVQQHNSIQTISRVNRKYHGKNKGLVVDYVGI